MKPRINTSDLTIVIPTWAHPELIEINDEKIRQICELIRVGCLTVSVFSKMETTTSINGINADSTALGNASNTYTPNRRKTRLIPPNNNPILRYLCSQETEFTAQEIEINTKPLEESGKLLRDTKNWVEFLDKELKSEFLILISRKIGTPKINELKWDLLDWGLIPYISYRIIVAEKNKMVSAKVATAWAIIIGILAIEALTFPAVIMAALMIFLNIMMLLVFRITIKSKLLEDTMEKENLGEVHFLPKDHISIAGVEPIKLYKAIKILLQGRLVDLKSK